MKTVVATLNAKYIHSSLAMRLLYVANKEKQDICFREFTIKEDVSKIAVEIAALQCDIIGLGVYIWNVKQSRQLVCELKRLAPKSIIVLGGPEVSYEPEFFLQNWPVDYIISGEGEFVLGELITALKTGESTSSISGLSFAGHISTKTAQADIEKLTSLESPYQLPEDKDHFTHRLIYFETSRGCPYQCQYCLSSLEKGVRYFSPNYIEENLSYLIRNGAKQIKFLDRTFNLNKARTRRIFDFLIANYRPGLSCQFEVYADMLTDDIIDYLNEKLPTDFFRFEIGIQSVHEPTNAAVKRKQDIKLLTANIRKLLKGSKVDLHLDLIAGLPHETFDLFVQSFNLVFALQAKELQLGFLKMLRGTGLRNNADKYAYSFDSEAPYQITENEDISSAELERIQSAEHALDKYWNSGRFQTTLNVIFEEYYKDKGFEFFDELAQFSDANHFPKIGYLLEDLFRNLNDFLESKNINLSTQLRKDYYSNFRIRPNGYWTQNIDKELKKRLLHQIGEDKDFLQNHQLTRRIIEKQTAIYPLSENEFLLTIFALEDPKGQHRELIYRLRKLQ